MKRIVANKIKINFFIIGLIIYFFASVFLESELNSAKIFLTLVKYSGLFFMSFPFVYAGKVNRGALLRTVVLFVLLSINSLLLGGGTTLLEIIMIVFFYKYSNIVIDKVFVTTIYSLVIGHMVTILGIVEDQITSRWFGNNMGMLAGENIRHQMGFLASNQVPLTLMIVYLLMIAYKKDKVSMRVHLGVLILNVITFKTFGARVSAILILFTFVSYYLVKRYVKKSFKFRFFVGLRYAFSYIFVICSLLSFAATFFYSKGGRIWIKINDILYNRLRWNVDALKQYGLTLFGKGLMAGSQANGNGEGIVDNAYVAIYIQRGLIISLVIICVWTYIMVKSIRRNDKFVVLALFVIAIASLIDNHLTSYKAIPFFCILVSGISERAYLQNGDKKNDCQIDAVDNE